MVFQNHMLLGVFNTYLGVQCIEGLGELSHCLAPLLMQHDPSHVLVFIVSNRVILFLERIKKIFPSGYWPKNYRFVISMSLTLILPPIFDMGKGLKE